MAGAPVLAGELGLLSLFDLGQLLMLNGATGALVVTRESRRVFLYFDRGQIVNALDETYREGEGAAYKIFTWKEGHFEFRPDTTAGSAAISESTEGLMMEAARRMDEASAEVGESDGAVEKLTRRAGALDALREAFQSVAAEAGSLPEPDHEAGGSPFALLRDASDALLFRPGHVPRLMQAGRWRSAGKQPLDPAAFDQLRTRLLEGVWNATSATTSRAAGVQTCVVTGDDQRRYSVTRVTGANEALWVRAAELTPPEVGSLLGDLKPLRTLLTAPSGLVLIGGPDAESADRMLHACVALLARERGGTVLLLADHGRWRHRDESGALLRAQGADAPELIRMLSPSVVAHDTACAGDSLAALTGAPLVLAAIVSPDAASLLPRWCARVARRWGDGIEAQLAGGCIGLVQSSRPTGDGHQAFAAQRVALGAEAPAEPLPSPGEPAVEAEPVAAAAPAEEQQTQREECEPPVPPAAGTKPSKDPFAALAAELTRTLRKAA